MMATSGPSTFHAFTILLMVVTVACVKVYKECHSVKAGHITSVSTLSEHDLKHERTMCARLCNRNGKCVSYFENSETKQCRLVSGLLDDDSDNVVQEPGWIYYARAGCGVGNGYVLDPESSLCVKNIIDKLSIPAARNRCAQDGGRLLEVRSVRQHLAVIKYLKSVPKQSVMGPTIGGHRVDEKSPWVFDDGTPVTLFMWHPTKSYKGNCLRYSERKYWKNAECDRKEEFLCQVP